jgi:hypothetical protein
MRLALAAVFAALATAAAAQEPPTVGPAVDQPGKIPEDKPTSAPEAAYDSRLLSSYAAAKSFMGPLDGGWRVIVQGRPLYELQLADRRDHVEGAWRRLDRKASGLVASAERTPTRTVLHFDDAVLTVRPDLTGELRRADAAQESRLAKITP